MRFRAGVLTHNPLKNGRDKLLVKTIKSIIESFSVDGPVVYPTIFDNGSSDNIKSFLLDVNLGGCRIFRMDQYLGADEHGLPKLVHTPGFGVRCMVGFLAGLEGSSASVSPDDIIVCSDDDMLWRKSAASVIEDFWVDPPSNVAILSAYLEPEWHWNLPRSMIVSGGVSAVIRDTSPAAAWTFPVRNIGRCIPIENDRIAIDDGWNFDTDLCSKMRDSGFWTAQIAACDHIGWGHSTHGNESIESSFPLNLDRWPVTVCRQGPQ